MNRLLQKIRMASFAVCLGITGFGYSQTYTFTSATAAGATGPSQIQADAEYLGTTLDGNVTVNAGIQSWTVPVTGSYHIAALGAQGGGAFGGLGASIEGDFNLTAGQVLFILAGQQGETQAGQPESVGGGGGTFVVRTPGLTTADILVIAGGGGGSASNAYAVSSNGSITNNGNNGVIDAGVANPNGLGGSAGNGGSKSVTGCSLDRGAGGGGFLTDGESICQTVGIANGGLSFLNGGAGGTGTGPGATGGFGGGGATWQTGFRGGGGGGGYSGGGGGQINSVSPGQAGGGGGSFNAGTTPIEAIGVQSGNGQVTITLNCSPTSLLADVATLSDLTADCILDTWTIPTATNDCNTNYNGTPDVSLPISSVGTTVVTWTYDDGVNTITQTQNVIITGIDTAPPVPDSLNLIMFSGECSYTPVTPTATDVCQGVISGTPDVTLPITAQGTTTITWTYDDGVGNTSTQTQDIILNDVVAPVPNVPTLSDIDECNEATPMTPTASDSCAGTIDGVPDVSFPITTSGTTIVTWTYTDANGNSVTQSQNVNISLIDLTISSTGPQLTANQTGASYQWIDCGTSQPIAGATSQMYEPSVTGEYAAIVTTANCSDTTECTLVDFTGIDELNSDYINIYPNPASSGFFTVDFDGVVDHITVVDALGREVAVAVDLTTGAVNGSSLEAGRYIVRVFASDAVYSKGLIIME